MIYSHFTYILHFTRDKEKMFSSQYAMAAYIKKIVESHFHFIVVQIEII